MKLKLWRVRWLLLMLSLRKIVDAFLKRGWRYMLDLAILMLVIGSSLLSDYKLEDFSISDVTVNRVLFMPVSRTQGILGRL